MRRAEDIAEQLGNVAQIESIVVAMRALAVAHSTEARRHLAAIRAQQATVVRTMAAALQLLPEGHAHAAAGPEDAALWIVVGATQGFSGPYGGRIVDAAQKAADATPDPRFMLIGARCISEFAEHGVTPVWSADMVTHAAEIPGLASRISDALFETLAAGEVGQVHLVFGDPEHTAAPEAVLALMPFDFAQIPAPSTPFPPMTTLPPPELLAGLVEEYIFTAICEALMLGFSAENDARMAAMTRARNNVQEISDGLHREFTTARQEQMTEEIVELSAARGR